jgi:glutamate synthase domain-containing protein 3
VETAEEAAQLLEMIELHRRYTGSGMAEQVVENWPDVLSEFIKVMPIDYKRVLLQRWQREENLRQEAAGSQVPVTGT